MIRFTVLCLILIPILVSVSRAQQDGKAQAQAKNLLPYERMMMEKVADREADSDPSIAVWRHYVKPERRDEFESLLRQYWRIGKAALQDGRMTSLQKQTFQSLHVLRSPPKDGHEVYLFLADPYVSEGDYRIETVLEMAYSQADADSLQKQLRKALARTDHPPVFTTGP
jgi:hypothetical protein